MCFHWNQQSLHMLPLLHKTLVGVHPPNLLQVKEGLKVHWQRMIFVCFVATTMIPPDPSYHV